MLNISPALSLPVEQVLGESVAILGIKGSGKSNTAAVFSEELLTAGVPVCIIDVAGEYYGLKEQHTILVAGRSPHVDLPVEPHQSASLAEVSLERGLSVILDVSGYRKEDRFAFLHNFLERLWDIAGEQRTPYQVIMDEAHNFMPQGKATPVKDILVTMAAEGRKRGLGIVMIGQRSARIEKDVLTQAGILVLHRVRHPSDVSVYQDIIPAERAWVKETVNALDTGEAIVFTGDDPQVVKIRERDTFHAGYTPGLDDNPRPALREIDATLLESLRQVLPDEKPVGDDPRQREIEQLKVQLVERDERIAELEAELEQQIIANKMLGALTIDVRQPEKIELGQMDTNKVVVGSVDLGAFRVIDQPVPAIQKAAAQSKSVTAPVDDTVEEDEGPTPFYSERAEKMRRSRQRSAWRKMIHRVKELPKADRACLALMLEKPGKTHTKNDMARRTGYSESSLRPKKLTDLRLAQKADSARNGRSQYSCFHTVRILRENYPALDVNELIVELQEVLLS